MITGKEMVATATEILGRAPTEAEMIDINSATTLDDVREICYGIARSRNFFADSYKGKADLKMTFLQAMCEGHGVDVILIREAFEEALEGYLETIEEDE